MSGVAQRRLELIAIVGVYAEHDRLPPAQPVADERTGERQIFVAVLDDQQHMTALAERFIFETEIQPALAVGLVQLFPDQRKGVALALEPVDFRDARERGRLVEQVRPSGHLINA